jgi:hypothetical protein
MKNDWKMVRIGRLPKIVELGLAQKMIITIGENNT